MQKLKKSKRKTKWKMIFCLRSAFPACNSFLPKVLRKNKLKKKNWLVFVKVKK